MNEINRYEDIILFRSLASHRLLGRMQEREKAQRMERRAARTRRRGRQRGAGRGGGGGGGGSSSRSRSSAESSSSADDIEEEGQDDREDDDGDANLEEASGDSGAKQDSSSGGMRSTIYRWTAGWIWGRADSSGETRADDGKEDNWDATRADLEKLLRETADVSTPSSQAAAAAFADSAKKSGRDSAKKTRRKNRVDAPKTAAKNEVVILHIFVEHGQLQLLNAPRSEAANKSGSKSKCRSVAKVHHILHDAA